MGTQRVSFLLVFKGHYSIHTNRSLDPSSPYRLMSGSFVQFYSFKYYDILL